MTSLKGATGHAFAAFEAAAFRVRRHYFGKRVKLNFLVNLKSGLCPEVDVALALRELTPDSVPVHFLIPFEGTPLGTEWNRTPSTAPVP